MLFLDGVYVDGPDGAARFRWVTAPTREELLLLAHTIAHRVGQYLERQGLLERLCRYISRPAVSEKRLSLTPNGNTACRAVSMGPYREKKTGRLSGDMNGITRELNNQGENTVIPKLRSPTVIFTICPYVSFCGNTPFADLDSTDRERIRIETPTPRDRGGGRLRRKSGRIFDSRDSRCHRVCNVIVSWKSPMQKTVRYWFTGTCLISPPPQQPGRCWLMGGERGIDGAI